MSARLTVEVWSDIACPWCSIGKRRLEAALASFAQRDDVDVVWRAFELDPSAPAVKVPRIPYAERLAAKYRTSTAQADEMIRRMTETAAAEGLDFRFDLIRPGNTFDAHRLIHFAAKRGLGDQAKERLLRAYMTEGEAIGDHAVLVRLATEIGLDPADVRALLAGDELAAEVRADEEAARSLGISGVPYFVIDGRYALSGAQPATALTNALQLAWRERTAASAGEAIEPGEACGAEGCS